MRRSIEVEHVTVTVEWLFDRGRIVLTGQAHSCEWQIASTGFQICWRWPALRPPSSRIGQKEHSTVNTLHPGAHAAGMVSPSADGPMRIGRRLYRGIAIVTTLMMMFGTLAFIAPAAHAKPASPLAVADLNVHPDLAAASGEQLSLGNHVTAQFNLSLVDLLVSALMDLVDAAPADSSPDVAPPAEADGIVGIIYAAADAYGQPRDDMLRVATCESNLNPNAVNSSSGASGLFQFMPGTWESTPYADQDIFDPVASANAAAWMWSVGRRNEWTCQ